MAGAGDAGVSPRPLNLRMDGTGPRRAGVADAPSRYSPWPAVALVRAAEGLSSDGSSAEASIAAAVAADTTGPTGGLTRADRDGVAWVAS
jgi:hypothetical protein